MDTSLSGVYKICMEIIVFQDRSLTADVRHTMWMNCVQILTQIIDRSTYRVNVLNSQTRNHYSPIMQINIDVDHFVAEVSWYCHFASSDIF